VPEVEGDQGAEVRVPAKSDRRKRQAGVENGEEAQPAGPVSPAPAAAEEKPDGEDVKRKAEPAEEGSGDDLAELGVSKPAAAKKKARQEQAQPHQGSILQNSISDKKFLGQIWIFV
jgi:hypothetical protein